MNEHIAENAAEVFFAARYSPLWDEGKPSGDCYQRAGFFMLANYDKPDAVLVHAEMVSRWHMDRACLVRDPRHRDL